MNHSFFDGLDELYHDAKFGEDRTKRAGCRCENVVFVTMFFVCHAPSPERRTFEGCIKHALRCRLLADFDEAYSVFFQRDCSFTHVTQLSHSLQDGATIFAKLRSKIAKSPKIGGENCAHHFVYIAEGFEKKFYCRSLGPRL